MMDPPKTLVSSKSSTNLEDLDDPEKTPQASPKPTTKARKSIENLAKLIVHPLTKHHRVFIPSVREQHAQELLVQFSKTFVSVMESTVFSKSASGDTSFNEEEADECFDDFERYKSYSSYSTLDKMVPIPMSDEEFAFEKYFQSDQKTHFRSIFANVAFSIFKSYEYQLIILVGENRKICEIAEDIVHRIIDNFKESQRGCNPDYVRPEITVRFLIELALEHSEPEGITYNSEWSAVEILENPGILIKNQKNKKEAKSSKPKDKEPCPGPGLFYQSDWQKNFIGVKKKIGSKYGFRLKFEFETEISILRNFEKVPLSSVYPPYLQYDYVLSSELLEDTRTQLENELGIEEKMKQAGNSSSGFFRVGDHEKPVKMKDKVKEFQIKLQIQKQEEDHNSYKVMKQVNMDKQREDKLKNRLERMEEKGVIRHDEMEQVRSGLLRSNYNVRFEVKDPNNEFQPF